MRLRMMLGMALMALLMVAACSGPAAPAGEATMDGADTAATMPAASAEDGEAEEMATEEAEAEHDEMAEGEMAEEEMTEDEAASDEAVSDEVMSDEAMAAEDDAAAERPAWQQLPITNASTGETFTLADFAGKTVYVEPFATWCTNCRQQLTHVNAIVPNFGDDVVFVVLSVEANISNDALAQYAAQHGFDMIFGAMSPDLLRETVAVFGQTITNPPATPHFVIRPDGTTTELFTGIEGPEEVTALITANQS